MRSIPVDVYMLAEDRYGIGFVEAIMDATDAWYVRGVIYAVYPNGAKKWTVAWYE